MKHDQDAWKRRIFWPPRTPDGQYWVPVEKVIAKFYPDISEEDIRAGLLGEVHVVCVGGRAMRFVHPGEVADAYPVCEVWYGPDLDEEDLAGA